VLVDFIEGLFGGDRGRDNVGGIIRSFSRWIIGCGCLLVLLIVGVIAAVLGGIINFGESAVTVIIVFVMIIVAIASLIRSNM
jgi:hypothetical protein